MELRCITVRLLHRDPLPWSTMWLAMFAFFAAPVGGTTYDTWADAIEWDGADSRPTADPNHDGIANLTAYAMDLSPVASPVSGEIPTATIDTSSPGGPWIRFTYRQNAAAEDLDVVVAANSDLSDQGWSVIRMDGTNARTEVIDTEPDGDGSARLMRTRVSVADSPERRFLRIEVTRIPVGEPVLLENWSSSPWNLAAGATEFSGTISDPEAGDVVVEFRDPQAGANPANPDAPDFTPATPSFFGAEGTGFGVGESSVGRFERGESFVMRMSHAFQLRAIRFAEFSGDEVIHLSWIRNGIERSRTIGPVPGGFYTIVAIQGVYADADTELRITNVSPADANANGRLRINHLEIAFPTTPAPATAVPGAVMILNDWTLWPWNGVTGATVMDGTLVAPENGGTPVDFTFTAQDGVDVSDPTAPDFSGATEDYFGYESTGFGVGDPTTGRFNRGEAIRLAVDHDYRIEVIRWRELDGDERIHLRWTSGGVECEQVLDVADATMEFSDFTIDGGTDLVMTNVSPDTSSLDGRLRIQDIRMRMMYDTPPFYDSSGPDGFVRMAGVNLAGAEFGGTAFWQTDPAQWDYYHAKGLNLIRIPFKWERIQPTLFGAVDFTGLDQVMALADNRGMKVVLDMHNYARRDGFVIGSEDMPNETFADVWRKIAAHFKNHGAIYGYGIMNEPHGTGGLWPAAAQAATDAIREVDANQWVIVGGENWSKASTWRRDNATLDITDPTGKLMYEAHVYFDSKYPAEDGGYGSYDSEAPEWDLGVRRVNPFNLWLQERGAWGFIGEYGTPKNDGRWNNVLEPFLFHLQAYGLSGTYWAGGKNWNNYALDCSPSSNYTVDAVQMQVLETYSD
ncbi:MAG: glycoside hydrolase family 5 protein [Verrucomicrobiae bacterium]|nr:glycoside hydrolase family 5 protein [Verrucomicrobiae bacterium]